MSVADSTIPNRAAHHPGAAATWPATPARRPLPDVGFERPAARRARNPYWRDRLIGVVTAAAAHAIVLFAFNGGEPEQRAVRQATEENIIPLVLPELEPPDAVEVVEVTDAPVAPQLAPPAQMDMPSAVALSDFVQTLRPTIDPGIMSVGAITIPAASAAGFGAQGGAGVKLFDLKDLDRTPRRVKTVMPVYPTELRRASIAGEVVLTVIIDPSGHVEVERVVSSTHREFEVAAIKAAEQCVFESPLRGGQRVSARYLWRIPFDIK